MGSRSYKDLVVWQKSMDLAESVYCCTRSFPGEEMYGITSQMRRAVASIPANIAEGQARNNSGEFRQFLGIAMGSLVELETWVVLCVRIGYLDSTKSETLLADCEEIQRLLNGLKKSLKPKDSITKTSRVKRATRNWKLETENWKLFLARSAQLKTKN
jgi:four helix bundle protein